ncbi:MAG: OadG family protein [Bacteroidales bacterium]|nr:OadG family protein [Bacteroidales bacterium]
MIINAISFDLSEISGFGITVAIVGYIIVFLALVLLFSVFNNMPRLMRINLKKLFKRSPNGNHAKKEEIAELPGEVSAAISAALYLYFNELHDEESNIMTIKKISKRYSPWSSKIYGLNQYFNIRNK